jgi:hypothetical protein
MSSLPRGRSWILGAVLLSGCVLAAGVVATSSNGASKVFKVDHQLCYSAVGHFPKTPTSLTVRLINQFSPNGFLPKINSNFTLHCNPVQKTVNTPSGLITYPVTNPAAHLACFPITEPTQLKWKVQVTNQFGSSVLVTGQPNRLCLPTWKSMTGPPTQAGAPPGLNHFTCYPVTPVPGAPPFHPPAVVLKDQFGQAPSDVYPVPTSLCLPTTKIIKLATGTKTYPIIDAKTHLLCFLVKHPIKPVVYDKNQFGTAKVTINVARTLCVPSTKVKLGPAG